LTYNGRLGIDRQRQLLDGKGSNFSNLMYFCASLHVEIRRRPACGDDDDIDRLVAYQLDQGVLIRESRLASEWARRTSCGSVCVISAAPLPTTPPLILASLMS
jgi:hypothetical protein